MKEAECMRRRRISRRTHSDDRALIFDAAGCVIGWGREMRVEACDYYSEREIDFISEVLA